MKFYYYKNYVFEESLWDFIVINYIPARQFGIFNESDMFRLWGEFYHHAVGVRLVVDLVIQKEFCSYYPSLISNISNLSVELKNNYSHIELMDKFGVI